MARIPPKLGFDRNWKADAAPPRWGGALSKGLGRLRLQAVADPRPVSRVRYSLPLILRSVLVGLVAGAKRLATTEVMLSRLSHATGRKLSLRGRIADTRHDDAR